MADPGRLDELKRKFEENPKRYFAPLANEYRKAGEPERAIELCRTYLPQQPTHMSGYIVYGQALHDAGQTEESAAVFKQALTLDPENIIALRQLGDIARNTGDRVAAMRWYGKVLELDPRNDEISAYITSLAQPGTRAFAPPAVPERQPPPTIRPEPAPDESAVSLEDIVSEPDVVQAPFVAEESIPEESAPEESAPEEEPAPEEAAPEEPFEPFGVADWPTAADAEAAASDSDSESEPILEGPWHMPAASDAADVEQENTRVDESTPLRFAEFMPEEDAAFAPTPEELDEPEPEPEPVPEPEPESAPEPAPEHADEPSAAPVQQPEASTPPPIEDDSPFVTETMAELYMRQGLRSEALAIYRQLVLRRDDPALRQRLAEIEAEPARPAAETVRAFFARIGAQRPNERVEIAAQRESSLDTLFGSAQLDANDVIAAQRLSGAFGNPQSGVSHS